VGIITDSAARLRSRAVQFAPALGRGGASTWTLRDVLIDACGCDHTAGPLAYWEWRAIHEALKEAREVLTPRTDAPPHMDVERWANQADRTVDEVLAVLEMVDNAEDVLAPESGGMRPWCDPRQVTTCRLPYIPLAAFTHAWLLHGPRTPLQELLYRYGLGPTTTSWDLLDRIDPEIRSATVDANRVRAVAVELRQWMRSSGEEVTAAKWLRAVAADEPDSSLDDLELRAIDANRPSSPGD
jgi:hypothetical protein